jgi:hypothetical protein
VETAKEGNEEGTSFSWQFILVSIYVTIVGCFSVLKANRVEALRVEALRVESEGKFAPFHSRKFFFTRMGPDKPDRAAAVQDMIPQSILRGVSAGILRLWRRSRTSHDRSAHAQAFPFSCTSGVFVDQGGAGGVCSRSTFFPDTFRAGYRTLPAICI